MKFENKTRVLKPVKKCCELFIQPKILVYARNCNFTDFDTISVLQFNCSNTIGFGLPCGVAAIVNKNEIM